MKKDHSATVTNKTFPPDSVNGLGKLALIAVFGAACCLNSNVTAGVPRFVTSNAKIPFKSMVFIDQTSAPEWVLFSGNFQTVMQTTTPSALCTPSTPCSLDARALVVTTDIVGLGTTSGLKYRLIGMLLNKKEVLVPGTTSLQPQCLVVLPRTIKPVGRAVTVPIQTLITLDEHGKILQAAAPPTGLLGWWQGEDTATDSVAATPTIISASEAVDFAPGIVGQSFHFNDSGFIEAQVPESFDSPAITAAAWVRADTSPGPFSYILSKGAAECDGASYALYTGANGGLQFYVAGANSAAVSADAGAGIWDGNWHFVAGTFEGTNVRLYVDGEQVGTDTPAPLSINYSLPNPNFYIGAYGGTCNLRFNGYVDEIQLFGRALSQAELLGIYDLRR